ncbi:hypothetical protein [Aureimonas glaciei]|uniref:Uncharacterized protein n=1 Tax=Aureimonas glaciei TaxID=1776957 RepID=A0A917DJQ2_9HYPH|nr:hypothetical protein [Aureimonas glaciei]GGD43121.1 hypothetical protein GCM10011335_52230 [Aureimonas glaciei]
MKRLLRWTWQFALGLAGYAAGVGGFAFFLGATDSLEAFFAQHRLIGSFVIVSCYIIYLVKRAAEQELRQIQAESDRRHKEGK